MALFSLDTPAGPIRLIELYQRPTYQGFIEGYPNARVNTVVLDRLPSRLRALFGEGMSVHVVPPLVPRRADPPIDQPEPWAELPGVLCAGLWERHVDEGLEWWSL